MYFFCPPVKTEGILIYKKNMPVETGHHTGCKSVARAKGEIS